MTDTVKKKFKLPHWLPFILLLAGVIGLMLLYVMFIANTFGSTGSELQKFSEFIEYAESCSGDITELTEHEFAKLDADDTRSYFITLKGDEQELRDRVFSGAYLAEISVSAATGSRSARYYYMWYDIDCVIIYDEGNAKLHTDGTDYSAVLTESLMAAVSGHQKE